MTEIGAGGITFRGWKPSTRFTKQYKKLSSGMRDRANSALEDLLKDPKPPGLGFEKYLGHNNPAVYTIRINGGYRISLEVVEGNIAFLRKIGTHDQVTRKP